MSVSKIFKSARLIALIPATLILLFFGILTLGAVPAPNTHNSEVVTDKMANASRPSPINGDMMIVLESGHRFYVNRANEDDQFAWETFLEEVQPGDEVTITAVKSLAQRLFDFTSNVSPVAGIETTNKIYMDPAVWGRKQQSQELFATLAICATGGWLVLARLFLRNTKIQQHHQPNIGQVES